MLQFVQTMSLSVILASGTILCGQTAMACGGCRTCVQSSACAAPSCAAPAMPATEMPMDHAGHAQAGTRTRYQSAYQAPTAQPQYYAPGQQYRGPMRNYDLRNDFQYQNRADRKIRGN